MKKIMIDMDDVICGGGFLALVNEFLGTAYREEDIKRGFHVSPNGVTVVPKGAKL